MLHDISPTLSPSINVWPGDTALTREVLCDLNKGDNITLSTLRTTVHLGAHADGPNHYGKHAPDIASRPLHHFLGPCTILDCPVPPASRVTPRDVLGGLPSTIDPRVLIRTNSFAGFHAWNADFAALSTDLVHALASLGVHTIGIDTPSVDLQDSKDLPAHHAILSHDISILEGLVLRDVPPGRYELIALPLKLQGFDASPVRAVLRSLA